MYGWLQTVAQFDTPIVYNSTQYRARVCGRQRDDGLWEGWIEFESIATGAVLRTYERQHNRISQT